MSSYQQPQGTSETEPTSCALYEYGECRGESRIRGDQLCAICYEAHPFVFEKFFNENPHLRGLFLQAPPDKMSPFFRDEQPQSCISRRQAHRNEAWVVRLIELRILFAGEEREKIRNTCQRYNRPEVQYNYRPDAIMCKTTNGDLETLCELCKEEVLQQDKYFFSRFMGRY